MRGIIAGLFLIAATGGAQASIVGGGLFDSAAKTQGGVFVELDGSTGFTVGNDNFQDYNLYAFDEDQNISVTGTVNVNVGTAPMAGDIVASHYVFYDAPGSSTTRQKGYVDFDADIYGVATSTPNLAASDFLANTSVTYLNPSLRGLENGDTISIDPGNSKRLLVNWASATPGDYVRVFTRFSPSAEVPVPAAGLLLIGALGLLSRLRPRS